jgi:hypothetical protein
MIEEKRKHHHIPVNAFVRFYPEDVDPLFKTYSKGVITNYSESGLCILTDHPLPKGCPVIVELPIRSEQHGLAIVEVRGRVCWVRQFKERRGMGIELKAFADASNRDFADWMKHLQFES